MVASRHGVGAARYAHRRCGVCRSTPSRRAKRRGEGARWGGGAASAVVAFVASGQSRVEASVLHGVAERLRSLEGGHAVVVVETTAAVGPGTEREGTASVSVIAFSAGAGAELRFSENLADLAVLGSGLDARPSASLVWLATEAHTAEALSVLAAMSGPLAGAGAGEVVVAVPREPPRAVAAASLRLRGALRMTVCASSAARRISPWATLRRAEGPLLLETERGTMVDLMGEAEATPGGHEPMLVALRPSRDDEPMLVRAIVGVDPSREAVMVSDVFPVGATIALAARNPVTARDDLTRRLSAVSERLSGAAPAGALLFAGAGRGVGLFGRPDSDAKVLRSRFAVPTAGMHSSFELACWDGAPRLHLFSAVVALFLRPS